jgi:hypothetical protein
MTRVLATETAKTAIDQMQSIITGGLTDQIQKLDGLGQQLSDPNNWDGNLAGQFRSDTWPKTNSALKQALSQLEELRTHLTQIHTNIFQAGGNA